MRGQFNTGGDIWDQVTLVDLVSWDTHGGDGDRDCDPDPDPDRHRDQDHDRDGLGDCDNCLVSWGTHGQTPADLTTASNWGPAKA